MTTKQIHYWIRTPSNKQFHQIQKICFTCGWGWPKGKNTLFSKKDFSYPTQGISFWPAEKDITHTDLEWIRKEKRDLYDVEITQDILKLWLSGVINLPLTIEVV